MILTIVLLAVIWAAGVAVALVLVGANDDDRAVARYEREKAAFEEMFE